MAPVNLLEFNVGVLRFLNLWPLKNGTTRGIWRTLKDFFLVFYVTPSFISVTVGLYSELQDENYDLSSITESLISIMCCIGLFYVIFCFVRNRDDIMKLVDRLGNFQEFGTPPDLLKTDKEAAMFTGCFLAYGMIGTLVYTTMPFVSIQKCEANKSQYMKDVGVPCGLVITKFYLPFRFDFTPRKEMVTTYQVTICITFSTALSALTMLLCGMLMHISTQLRYLGSKFKKLADLPQEAAIRGVRTCIRHHITIIEYATKTNGAFSSMMLLHITVTSFVISILGYQVLLTNSYADSLRYGLHLGGWLSILFLVCYNGQNLIDEVCEVKSVQIKKSFGAGRGKQRRSFLLQSVAVARKAYFASWYSFPASVQRDLLLMIERAQRPLPLTALNFGVMSLATYLQVMSTAYQYFTLLLKMKS